MKRVALKTIKIPKTMVSVNEKQKCIVLSYIQITHIRV